MNVTHRMTNTTTYQSWEKMRTRCNNVNSPDYARYGGSGISVCSRWNDSLIEVISDMGVRPDGTSIDRIDNKKGYQPGNCRWATPSEQNQNQTTTKLNPVAVRVIRYCHDKLGRSQAAIARAFGISQPTISDVVNRKTWGNI